MVMHRKTGRWLLIVALTTAPSVGCKSGITFWNPFAKPTATPGSPMLQGDADGGYMQAPMPQAPEPRAEEFGWTAPFKKFGETISSPFKKSASNKPKPITPEDDPISLSSRQAPDGAKIHIALADVHKRAGKLEAAIEQYKMALEEEPKNLQALLGLARIYDNTGDRAKALKYYQLAVKYHEDSATAQNDLGLCLIREKKPKESIAALEKAIEIEPTKALYRNNLARILVELDRTPEAYKILVPVHGEAVAHYNIGFLLNERGLKPQALEQFRLAAQLDPNLKVAKQWINLLSPGEVPMQIAATPPTAGPATPATLVSAPISAPVADAGPRYSPVQPTTPPAGVASRDTVPLPRNAANSVNVELKNDADYASQELTPEGVASILAAKRAVETAPLSGGPDNAARVQVVPLKTVEVPGGASNPSLDTPIPSPIVVPGRAAPQFSVDNRPQQSSQMTGTGAPSGSPIGLPPVSQPAGQAAPPRPATTPLPPPEEELQGPRLSDRSRNGATSVAGERYATGGRYGTGNAAAPSPSPTAQPATRPSTAARSPASRY